MRNLSVQIWKAIVATQFLLMSTAAFGQDSTYFSPHYSHPFRAFNAVWFDANGDRLQDLWFNSIEQGQHFFVNLGNGLFADSIDISGLRSVGNFGGGVAGDINGDGLTDIFLHSRDNVGAPSKSELYLNVGGLRFMAAGSEMGVDRGGTGETSLMFDFDGDGDLDIFSGFNHGLGSGAFLYRNDGVRFTEVLEKSGLERDVYFEGAQALDFNADGYVDLAYSGRFFLNKGDGTFLQTDIGMQITADEGICFVDLDNDGDLDLVFNPSIDGIYRVMVFENINGDLIDRTSSVGVNDSLLLNHWGVTSMDVDNDGLKDLLIGFRYEGGVVLGDFLALKNIGGFVFADWTEPWGLKFQWPDYFVDLVAPADFDNDGHVDFFVNGHFQGNKIWRNESRGGEYLRVRVVGERGQENQFGARVFLRQPALPNSVLTDFVGAGPGYNVKGMYDIHFAVLGDSSYEIEVVFPSGLNQIVTIDKEINPVLGLISPSTLGANAIDRTVEIRRNGDVIVAGTLHHPLKPILPVSRYPTHSSYYVPAGDSLVNLIWDSIPDAEDYDVEVSPLSRFDTLTTTYQASRNDVVVPVNDLKHLFWRVRANVAAYSTPWSSPSYVFVDSARSILPPKAINRAPEFATKPDSLAFEDSLYSYSFDAQDQLGDGYLGFRATTLPSWLQLDTLSRSISGVPVWVQAVDTIVSIEAYDGMGGISRHEFGLRVIHVNHNPVINSVPGTIAFEDSLFWYKLHATDKDTVFGDVLSYSIIDSVEWLQMDSTTGMLVGIPGPLDVGDNAVSLEVNDGNGGIAIQSFTVNVVHTNHPPSILSFPDTLVFQDSVYLYNPQAIDIDSEYFGDILRYRSITLPSWLELDSLTGAVVGSPADRNVGDTLVVLEVYDDSGATARQQFPLHIIHLNHPPVILTSPPLTGVQGGLYWYTPSVVDIDTLFNNSLRFSLTTSPEWMTVSRERGFISGVPGTANESAVTLRVDDGKGGSDSQSFVVTVAPAETSPVVAQWVLPGSAYTLQVSMPYKPLSFVWPGEIQATSYLVRIWGNDVDTTFTSIADTILTIPLMRNLSPQTDYLWSVGTVMGSNVASIDTFAFRTSQLKIGNTIVEGTIPADFVLHQNYPNPFNPTTTIIYGLPEPASVRFEVFNILGQLVFFQDNPDQQPGYYDIVWNATARNNQKASSGVYIFRLTATSPENQIRFLQTKKMVLLR